MALALLLILSIFSCTQDAKKDNNQLAIVEDRCELLYGLDVTDLSVSSHKIAKNEFIGEILNKLGASALSIHHFSDNEALDVKRIKVGDKYTIISHDDCTYGEQTSYMVYEPNALEYVVIDFDNDLKAEKFERPTTIKTETASGVIHSSLWQTLIENDMPPVLAVKMSQIFDWTVDFYKIQQGDKFKIIYDQRYVEDEPLDVAHIHGVYFEHFKNPFYAIYYETDPEIGKGGYYNEKGEGMKKQFLMSPLEYGRISSSYNLRRFHPVQKRYKAHLGTDYAAPRGTPIRATGSGVIIAAAHGKYNGKYVKIKHNGTYTTQYLHMNGFAKGTKVGKYVNQGDVIGYVGSTGLATGPHVCYRFWKKGKQVNHRKEMMPPAEPVDEEKLPEFMKVKEVIAEQLAGIQIFEKIESADIAYVDEELKLDAQQTTIQSP